MLLTFSAEETPCAVLFDVFKRQAHMSHSDLAESILSTAMLPDGRSVVAHAYDRSWLSRNVVHAPVDVAQARLFADFGYSGRAPLHVPEVSPYSPHGRGGDLCHGDLRCRPRDGCRA